MNLKQRDEIQDAEGFLKTLGLQAIEIEASDKPDVIACIETANDSGMARIGIEVRRHFNDEHSDGGSPGQQVTCFWADVRQEIETLRSESGSLQQIHAFVAFDKGKLLKRPLGPLRKKVAREIFEFVTVASETATSDLIVIPDWKEREFREFEDYPTIQECVTRIKVAKGFFALWDANVNATHVGINPTALAAVICEKSEKARDYRVEELDELWLLIAAPHDNVFNAMHSCPDQIDFANPELVEACNAAPFDKVYFWSSEPHEWVKQIWPPEAAG